MKNRFVILIVIVAGLMGLTVGYFIAKNSYKAATNYENEIVMERASRPPVAGAEIYYFSATVVEVGSGRIIVDSSPLMVSEIKLNSRTKITATILKPVADFKQEILAYNSVIKQFGSNFIPGAPGTPEPPSASIEKEIRSSELRPGVRIDVESREDISGKTSIEAIAIVVK